MFEDYLPPLTKNPDFTVFWEKSLAQGRGVPLHPEREKCEFPYRSIEVYRISYCGYDQTPLIGWFLLPVERSEKLPCVLCYHGFGGARAFPHHYLPLTDLGCAVLAMDVRGQNGESGDLTGYRTGGGASVMCHGLLDKEEYYLRRLYIDAVKAIDFAALQPEVDSGRILVNGGSQGGALSMAAACLDRRVSYCFCDVPSNSDLPNRVQGFHGSFSAVSDYLKSHPCQEAQVYDTLSYFDLMNMAEWISCPVFASVGLKDTVCPAKCYYASYNRIRAEKEIHVYPLSGHEGGGAYHDTKKLWKIKEIIE